MGRPAISQAQLQRLPDGRYSLRFKRPWSDGSTAVVLTGPELVARLAALVPPPRMHLVRYYGLFAPRARLREKVVPAKPPPEEHTSCEHAAARENDGSASSRQQRMTWAQLLKRVFEIDILACPRCHARMQHISVITSPDVVRRMLASMHRGQGP
jgi:hypothetical protein